MAWQAIRLRLADYHKIIVFHHRTTRQIPISRVHYTILKNDPQQSRFVKTQGISLSVQNTKGPIGGIIDFFPGFRYDFFDFLSGKDDIPLCPLSLPPS